MKLSFVIPAHNEENYVGKCLESIVEKTKGKNYDVEIVVVNNASSDRTGDIAAAYEGVRVVDEPRKGLSRARQTGLENTTGELIANVDADAVMPQGWIERVLGDFGSDPELVGLSGPPVFYDVPKTVKFWVRVFNYGSYIIYFVNRHILDVSSVLQGGNFVVRRDAMIKIGGFNPEFSFYGEDADVAHRLHRVGHVNFTFQLPMMMSGRRVMAEGKVKIAFRYLINYIWTVMFGRPFTTTSVVVREKLPD